MKKVVVVSPMSWDYVPTSFLLSWTNILTYAIGRYHMPIIVNKTPYLDYARDSLAKEALKENPDYILWLDADQTYPQETPEILMKHVDDGKLVVGGVTPLRQTGQAMIYDFTNKRHVVKFRKKFKPRAKPIKVGGMGMGGIMVHPAVFKRLKYPYFQMEWNKETDRKSGEDIVFYQNCKDVGLDVWCGTDLHYGHIVSGVRELKR